MINYQTPKSVVDGVFEKRHMVVKLMCGSHHGACYHELDYNQCCIEPLVAEQLIKNKIGKVVSGAVYNYKLVA